ncbi:MAG: glycosyltransferase, partial [bacterium]|nr:glycosyltransferase [bacterium]
FYFLHSNMKKVLIVSQRSGAGHERAAAAMEKAFKPAGNENLEIKRVDFLDYAGPTLRGILGRGYTELAKRLPEVYGFLDIQYGEIGSFQKYLPLFKIGAPDFTKLLKSEKPDVIVSTHPMPAALILDLKKRKEIAAPLGVVITDYKLHLIWVVGKNPDLDYFVASEEMVWDLERTGIPAQNIHLTGIPIDPIFSQKFNREVLAKSLNLKKNKLTVLLFAGSFGSINILEILNVLKQFKEKLQIIAITGKDEKLYKKILRFQEKNADFLPRVFSWIQNIEELMAVSDVLISKPGGITVSEANAMGLPLIVINPIPGQEEANAVWLLENDAGLWALDQRQIILKIMTLINHPVNLQKLKKNARRLARPKAAMQIAAIIKKKYLKE